MKGVKEERVQARKERDGFVRQLVLVDCQNRQKKGFVDQPISAPAIQKAYKAEFQVSMNSQRLYALRAEAFAEYGLDKKGRPVEGTRYPLSATRQEANRIDIMAQLNGERKPKKGRKLGSKNKVKAGATKSATKKPFFSASARKRISEAQKARWAEKKAKSGKSSSRTIAFRVDQADVQGLDNVPEVRVVRTKGPEDSQAVKAMADRLYAEGITKFRADVTKPYHVVFSTYND